MTVSTSHLEELNFRLHYDYRSSYADCPVPFGIAHNLVDFQ